MNYTDNIQNFGVFYIDKQSIEQLGSTFHSNKNGFLYCKKGSAKFTLNNKVFNITKGSLLVYPPFSTTHISEMSDDILGIVAIADFDFMVNAIQDFTNSQNLITLMEYPLIEMSPIECEKIEELINIIYKRKLDGYTSKIQLAIIAMLGRALCYQIISFYFEKTTITPVKQERKDLIFQNFMVSLNRNYREHRDVRFYADEQYLSARYFTTIIKETTGESALVWINKLLIIKAKQLLESSKMSIKEVSNFMGFPNQSFFGRFFKKHIGISPAKYKRENSGNSLKEGNNLEEQAAV